MYVFVPAICYVTLKVAKFLLKTNEKQLPLASLLS